MMRTRNETVRASRWSRGWSTVAIALLLVWSAAGVPQAAQNGRAARAHVDKEVETRIQRGAVRTRVIIRVAPGYRASLKNVWKNKAGNSMKREHRLLSALTMEMPTAGIDALARTPGVLSVSIDAPVKAQTVVPVTDGVLLQQTLGYVAADGSAAPASASGSLIRASRPPPISATASPPSTTSRCPRAARSRRRLRPLRSRHHVAGLVGGNGARSNGLYKGVAPGVSLIGLRVLGAEAAGTRAT